MSRNAWKQKLKLAKTQVSTRQEQEAFEYQERLHRAQEAGDADLVHKIQSEWEESIREREIQVTGKKRKPVIKDQELFDKNKKANFKRRKGVYTWADGGREEARTMRTTRKRSMESPVAELGTLATVSRNIDRFEFGYDGAVRGLRKGEVVMPIGDVYFSSYGDKKVVDVMCGSQIFKGLPIATLRPVDEM
jgi:hypothetical protein